MWIRPIFQAIKGYRGVFWGDGVESGAVGADSTALKLSQVE